MNLADAAAWKSYFWPGSYILRNRLGIRDANKLAEAEALLTNQRLEEGVPAAPATPDGYRSIHQFIFQDIYDWAGEYRTANMRHPNHFALFCKKEFIAAQMTLVFDPLRALPAGSLVSPQSGPGCVNLGWAFNHRVGSSRNVTTTCARGSPTVAG